MKNNGKFICYAILSGFFYSLPFLFPSFFFLSWIAFVPILFAIESQSYLKTYYLGLVFGVTAYIIGMHWMAYLSHFYFGLPIPFHFLFLFFFSIVAGHFIALFLLLFKFLEKNSPISSIFLFPTCFVFLSFLNPFVFHVSFASTQARFLSAIQSIEFAGIESLSWLLLFLTFFYFTFFLKKSFLKLLG